MSFSNKVREEELSSFSEKYKRLMDLRDKYSDENSNRRELSKEISVLNKELKDLMAIFNSDLSQDKHNCDFPNVISEPERMLKVLLALVNQNTNKYELKEYNVSQGISMEIVYGSKEYGSADGSIWVIGKRSLLDRIDENKTKPQYYKNELTKIVNENNSLVVITDFCYDWDVLPFDKNTPNARIKEFPTYGLISCLCCYTYDDELGDAVDKLSAYIDTYGGDIDNISIDLIVKRANEEYDKLGKKPSVKVIFRNSEEEKVFSKASQSYNYPTDSLGRQKTLDRIDRRNRK